MSQALHLAKRFAGSLRPGGPSAADEAWAASLLNEGEQALWRRMSGPDRRHAVLVARAVAQSPVASAPGVLPAALLHDVGKVEAGLGTVSRVAATLARPWGRAAWAPDRFRRYYEHPRRGADLLAAAGSHPTTVAWALEHHLPRRAWTVPAEVGRVLKAADDD